MSRDIWTPWHGCRKYSEGCDHCYMYYLDAQRDRSGAEGVHRDRHRFCHTDGIGQCHPAPEPMPAATKFLAMYRAIYAAVRSILVGSLPDSAPPPWLTNGP